MEECCRIHLSHVSVTRMIAQGIYGLSRVNTTEGIMGVEVVVLFAPSRLPVYEKISTFRPCLEFWLVGNSEFLTPEVWFIQVNYLEKSPGGEMGGVKSFLFINQAYSCGCLILTQESQKYRN